MSSSVKEFVDSGEGIDEEEFLSHLEEVQEETKALRSSAEGLENRGGKLDGLPVSVKEQICTEDFPTTAGSKILENYNPVFDATVVERLKEEGASIIGKTNMDEFGFGTFCTNSAFEVPRNPHDTDRVVGGSSGGAGALTAALNYPHIALAESTGGSISAPAAFNGVIGITPTYGRVSRHGLIDYGNSLDKIGVMSKSVYGAALGLEIIAGKDENDFTTVEKEKGFVERLEKDVKDMKIGVPKQYLEFEGMEDNVKERFEEAVERLEELGAEVERVNMEKVSRKYAVPAYYIIAVSEASTNLARYSGMRYGKEGYPEGKDFNEYFSEVRSEHFGEEVKRRIMLGTYARQAGYREKYYVKALKARTLIIDEFKEAFERYDILASPAMPIIAPTFKEAENLSPAETYAMDTLTVGPNLAGLPHASVPMGFSEGMPTGLHLIGDHFEEQKVLNAAAAYEEGSGHDMAVEV
ncbi:MAG: Asp-tRNA(Asn)/Glu-tRNA(Gln) amidotransferase subunit GatA [Candidatus Nanohaloarchaeota archaeon QJJ-7]|nr:Asp-tRNA(Asn)/Glu-tRNA(Gln) amidotransferase subunit GatA [Candidatus Nanohaloarchaeota archaeon QJJ-7]